MPKEGRKAYEKFQQFLALGPRRTKAATARAFGAAGSTIHQLAGKYRWDDRAKAWDVHHGLLFDDKSEIPIPLTPIPERLQQVASQAVAPAVDEQNPVAAIELQSVADEIRALELEHERKMEEFRSESETLGRHQMKLARAMTQITSKSISRMIERDEILHPRAIPGFISAACTLAASAHHIWAKSIGVDRLLLSMERAVMELEQRTLNDAVQDAEVIG